MNTETRATGLTFLTICTLSWLFLSSATAELTDITQTPNAINAGIQKSLEQQIGAGRADINTPDSSRFIIKRDPFRAIRRGRQIFQRKFTRAQGVGPRTNDGIGDIANDASLGAGMTDSCAACHGRPKGSAGFGGDVFTQPDSRDAPHLFGLGLVEMLADEITRELRAIRNNAVNKARYRYAPVSAQLTSKGIHYGSITAYPNGSVDSSAVKGVNRDLRVRPFFHEGRTISIREFVVGAFSDEMGLESADRDLARASRGADIRTPSGMLLSGSIDAIQAPPAHGRFDDPDGDGKFNEIPMALVDHMEFYLLNYFRPATYQQTNFSNTGKQIFNTIGCNSCHIPNLLINRDRRVADVATVYDSSHGIFNNLFATATPLFKEVNDGSGFPTKKLPVRGTFMVQGIYADFKRHDLGPNFWERRFDGTLQKKFMTEPLWGVGSTAPYGHDGRSINLNEVILRHGGDGGRSRNAYDALTNADKRRVIAFLQSLVLFPPDDTASNLNPGDPNAPDFPQNGHGSIRLPVLFNNPSEPE